MGGGDHDFLAPSSMPVEPASQRMTNSDFRKLMMTPRAGQTPALPSSGGENTPGGGAMSGGRSGGATPRSVRMDKGKAEERRKKKTYYAKLKKDEDDKMAELAEKYRDRARERRDGGEPGVVGEESTNAYRAVAPNARETHDAAERRRQMIHESKYLGGDMEHTHLVKGLDFALLQKVRSEIVSREQMEEEEEENEEEEEKEVEKKVESKKENEKKEEPEEDKPAVECRTVVGKNIMRLMLKPEGPKVNELFMPGRMAYVMDLEDEGESDIPTTSIRSKKDVINNEQKATLSTNDIVINKLTQILSYLRAGNRTKKKKKEKMGDLLGGEEEFGKGVSGAVAGGKGVDLPIYDDVGDYKSRKEDKKDRRDDRREKDRGRDGDKRRDDRRDRDRERDKYREGKERDRERERWVRGEDKTRKDKEQDGGSKNQTYFDKPQEREKDQRGFTAEDKEMIKALMKKEEEKEKQKDDKKLAGMMQSSSHDG